MVLNVIIFGLFSGLILNLIWVLYFGVLLCVYGNVILELCIKDVCWFLVGVKVMVVGVMGWL